MPRCSQALIRDKELRLRLQIARLINAKVAQSKIVPVQKLIDQALGLPAG